jgi:hypothetical protein
MRRFPRELADLFSPAGRRFLHRPHRLWGALSREGRRFIAFSSFVDRSKSGTCLALLEKAFPSTLTRMERPVDPLVTWGMTENYSEQLPKTARVSTALLQSKKSRAYDVAEDVGLIRMLQSPSFHEFAEKLNGRPVRAKWGIQLLCYQHGDYAGPHNDHHPEDEEARDGYLDVHMTFANESVSRQLLVYERQGHLSQVQSVRSLGGITAYRLPFWHYTTPLEARKGREQKARRWVLLGTFLDRARPRPDR